MKKAIAIDRLKRFFTRLIIIVIGFALCSSIVYFGYKVCETSNYNDEVTRKTITIDAECYINSKTDYDYCIHPNMVAMLSNCTVFVTKTFENRTEMGNALLCLHVKNYTNYVGKTYKAYAKYDSMLDDILYVALTTERFEECRGCHYLDNSDQKACLVLSILFMILYLGCLVIILKKETS